MRGEHLHVVVGRVGFEGSSPHARGARTEVLQFCWFHGIIPACAGSTVHHGLVRTRDWDHPRMRGEHLLAAPRPGARRGSSPHARGALAAPGHAEVAEGIIPACAGSTANRPGRSPGGRDHPRMRGEHLLDAPRVSCATGSSPHARGAQPVQADSRCAYGIIPACAGSTACSCTGSIGVGGSSPHARGALDTRQGFPIVTGIIPACAGSTRPWHCPRLRNWDHPRMRGEHVQQIFDITGSKGSSPHARGAHRQRYPRFHQFGIIPACAGSTLPRSRR